MILNEFYKVSQSNTNVNLDDSLIIRIGIKTIPKGSGKKYANLADFIANKNCIVKVINDDNLCAFRSIAIAIE